MMCWFCQYGVPKPIADIYQSALKNGASESAMHYGPAHVVWADFNFARSLVEVCLDDALAGRGWHPNDGYSQEESEQEKAAVIQSLRELLTLPDDVLEPPASYAGTDGEPPPADMVLVHI